MSVQDYKDDGGGQLDELETSEGPPMGFLDHMEEFRWTLIKSFSAFALAAVLVVVFLAEFSGMLTWPYRYAAGDVGAGQGLITYSPMAVFSVVLQVTFLGGIALSLPFILYFVGQFVAPALTAREKKIMLPACLASAGLFLGGALFAFFVLMPQALRFSMGLNRFFGFELLWSADRYYSMLVWVVLGLGFMFQFPLLILLLVHLEIIDSPKLREWRRWAIVIFFCVGALITPTWDPLTQAIVAVPMWIIYELTILIAARLEKRRAEAQKQDLP